MTARIEKPVIVSYRRKSSLNHAAQFFITTEKESTRYPLPAEEGQTDTPIKHHNQGEVLMTGRIEKSVSISLHHKSSPSTMQPNLSSPQKRNRPHTLSPRERDKPTRRSIISIRVRS